MKPLALCALIGGLVFCVGLSVQMGANQPDTNAPDAASAATAAKSVPDNSTVAKAPIKRLRFPDDLAPATLSRPRPIAQTPGFSPAPGVHKLAMLKPGGALHEWQDYIPEEWRASKVEETELLVIVGAPKKTFVDETPFQIGPPIRRYIFDVAVSIVDPKTGQVLAYRTFRNLPRSIRNMEAYETSRLGRPVSWSAVYRWLAGMTRIGFPEEHDPNPIINQTDA